VARSEVTDEDVVAAAGGDADALGRLYSALAPPVLGYLRAHGVEDAEAVTQDVFVALLSRVPTVTGGVEGVRRLAFTIARARMVDATRARARRPGTVSYDPDLDDRTVASAADDAQHRISLARIQAVLSTLPPDQREVLTLRVVADLSIEEVASIIGRSPGAVKQLQRRALIALRQSMGERHSWV
jgi:RNA polymerase sigma-70 factor (ECF subfamily)